MHQSAVSKTALAADRTLLASDRTFTRWVRTDLGCIATGVGFHALFAKMHPAWVPRMFATLFLLLAGIIIWLAAVMRRLNPHVVASARKKNLQLIATAVSVGALALALAIWFLPVG
jgi:putative membrane protein